MRVYITDRRRVMKRRAVEYKGGKCELCGYDKCIQALEFHHPDPKAKEFHISHGSYGWDRVRSEIEKCKLLCCRCHREIHAEWEKELVEQTTAAKIRDLERATLVRKERAHKLKLREERRKPSSPVLWPSDQDLQLLLDKFPATEIAKSLGVSDVTVLKRARRRGLQTKPIGYWSSYKSA